MNQALLEAVEPYWIYDYDVAQSLDPKASLLKSLAQDLKLIQIRVKSLEDLELKKQVKTYYDLIKEANPACYVIMNDHVDLCAEFAMEGVHLGQSDDSVFEARKSLGQKAIIGLTVRSLEEAQEAQGLLAQGIVDYVGVGTVFQTTTKQGLKAKGSEFIEEVFKLIPAEKVYPIGGINKDNLSELKKIDVKHVALCSELYKNPDVQVYCGVR